MSKPVDWTFGIPASTLIAVGTQVSGRFPLDGAGARNLLYRMDGKNGSDKYVVIKYSLAQNIVVMMNKIPNSTNMVF